MAPTTLTLVPAETDLFPHLEKDSVCIYCGRFQTDEQAEQRTAAHITADLLAIHRTNEGLKRTFGIDHPGYDDDVYDLLCELDTAERTETAPAEMEVARMSSIPELTITATAHTDCDACEMSAEGARSYVANGGRITNGKAGNSQIDGGPHWATFTTEPAPALAETTSHP